MELKHFKKQNFKNSASTCNLTFFDYKELQIRKWMCCNFVVVKTLFHPLNKCTFNVSEKRLGEKNNHATLPEPLSSYTMAFLSHRFWWSAVHWRSVGGCHLSRPWLAHSFSPSHTQGQLLLPSPELKATADRKKGKMFPAKLQILCPSFIMCSFHTSLSLWCSLWGFKRTLCSL